MVASDVDRVTARVRYSGRNPCFSWSFVVAVGPDLDSCRLGSPPRGRASFLDDRAPGGDVTAAGICENFPSPDLLLRVLGREIKRKGTAAFKEQTEINRTEQEERRVLSSRLNGRLCARRAATGAS